jgi:hypothetical protein
MSKSYEKYALRHRLANCLFCSCLGAFFMCACSLPGNCFVASKQVPKIEKHDVVDVYVGFSEPGLVFYRLDLKIDNGSQLLVIADPNIMELPFKQAIYRIDDWSILNEKLRLTGVTLDGKRSVKITGDIKDHFRLRVLIAEGDVGFKAEATLFSEAKLKKSIRVASEAIADYSKTRR